MTGSVLAAALERRGWPMDRVWTEYEETHDRLEAADEAMPADRWDVPARYPWNECGTVAGLVVLMTEHETADHGDLVKAAATPHVESLTAELTQP